MDYVYYVLTILGLLIVCLSFIRFPRRLSYNRKPVNLATRKSSRPGDQDVNKEAKKAALQRENMKVPTPWGWPGSEYRQVNGRYAGLNAAEIQGVSESLHRWVDQMVSSKQTVDDNAYRMKREASMRALLEDRFGRSAQPGAVTYSKTRPPLLRDPSQPHDQMDNFPSGTLDKIENQLNQQATPREAPAREQSRRVRYQEIKEIRTPWGW